MADGGAERRRSARIGVLDNRTAVGWADVAGGHHAYGRLMDLSLRGARVSHGDLPEVGRQVWVRLAAPVPTAWAAARVVHRGPWGAGLEFAGRCPIDLLLGVALGVHASRVLDELAEADTVEAVLASATQAESSEGDSPRSRSGR